MATPRPGKLTPLKNRAQCMLPPEEVVGENGILIVARDEANGSIESTKITSLTMDVLS